ncbi:hypothetical protein [Okeania sp. SIO1I7]|uniref:hypothetical protein n=1 Tax=Okeania sp. SIO1I7 TaxID=2607772 RepID=UPI0013FB4980|nr:hypothetical protein [Okeania sp. SIO1I7]NET26132.1 hypothetical protein [Okeania sp. SIO1I7]
MENNSTQENQTFPSCIETQEVTPINLMYKIADLAIENSDAGLILAGALGSSIIICAIAHSATKLIRALR